MSIQPISELIEGQMSASDLMRQAPLTANEYFHCAIRKIDEKFGEGYAEKNPELIGHFMQTSAADFSACFLALNFEDQVAALNRLAAALENNHE